MSQSPGFETQDLSGRHPVNIGHLVMGLAFVGVVGVWALIQGDVVQDGDIRWLLPVPWVLAGIVGLLATTLTGRDRWGERQTGWVGPDAGTPATAYTTYGTDEAYAAYEAYDAYDPYDVPDSTPENPHPSSDTDTEETR